MKKSITLSRPNDRVQQVKSMSRATIGSVPSKKVFVDKKSKKPKYPQKYDEDFSLKPKSSTDAAKRKVNAPNPNHTGAPFASYTFDGKPRQSDIKRSGVSQGPYKDAVKASKYRKSRDSFDRETASIRKGEYKDSLKAKGIKTEGIMDIFKSKKKPEEPPKKPHIMKYDRYNDFYHHEIPEFKPEWQKYSSKNKDLKKEETEIKDPLKPRDEKWFKVKGKEVKKDVNDVNRDRVGYVRYVGESSEAEPFKAAVAKQMSQHGADASKVNNQMKRIDQKYKRIQSVTK